MSKRNYHINGFRVDNNLMYLIQTVSGHSTEQILSYFYRMATGMIENYLTKKNLASSIKKELNWHYEGFNHIHYKLGAYAGNWSKAEADSYSFFIDVSFPKSVNHVEIADAVNKLVENALGLEGAEPMEKFPAPYAKVPAGFKKFLHD